MGSLLYVLYDGPCALCQGLVRFALSRPAAARCRFVPLEAVVGTPVGERLAARLGEPLGGTVVVVQAGEVSVRSEAVLALMAAVGPAAPAATWLRRLPRAWRDALYDRVAGLRTRLFGRREAPLCERVSPEHRALLLEALPEEALAPEGPTPQPPGPK